MTDDIFREKDICNGPMKDLDVTDMDGLDLNAAIMYLREEFKEFKKKHPGAFDLHLCVEQDYDGTIFTIMSKRYETEKEMKRRIELEEQMLAEQKAREQKSKASKEKRERAEYLRLKKKFEKEGS